MSAIGALVCNKGITQFYLPPTHEPYLPSLPSRKASTPFGYSWTKLPLRRPAEHPYDALWQKKT